jgi:hypothetical protein
MMQNLLFGFNYLLFVPFIFCVRNFKMGNEQSGHSHAHGTHGHSHSHGDHSHSEESDECSHSHSRFSIFIILFPFISIYLFILFLQ